METQDFSNLSNEELTIQYKKEKQTRIIRTFSVGAIIGASIYGAINKGLAFAPFFLLVIILIIADKKSNYKILNQEMKRRNLK